MPLRETLDARPSPRFRFAALLLLGFAAVAVAAGAPQAPAGAGTPVAGPRPGVDQAAPDAEQTRIGLTAPCLDEDFDGYVVCDGTCTQGAYSCGECDDTDASIHPGGVEVCNQKDDDCDGFPDEGFPAVDTTLEVPSHSSPAQFDGFGASITRLGDVDGDGVPDLAVGAKFWKDAVQSQVGSVEVISGANRSLLCRIVDPSGGTLVQGDALPNVADVGDMNGDGLSDLAVSGSFGGPIVDFFSPAGCTFIKRCGGVGAPLAAAGDLNLDGVPDLVVGLPHATVGSVFEGGLVKGISGFTCGTLFSFSDPLVQTGDNVGTRVAGIADVTGDGRPDLLATSQRFVYVLSGGALVRRIAEPATTGVARFGGGLVSLPDVSGDGIEDIAAGTLGNNTPLDSAGSVLVVSGATGSVLRRCADPLSGSDRLAFDLAMVPDQNGDGIADLLAGSPFHDTALGTDAGNATLFSGANCGVLRRFEDPAGAANMNFGSAVAATGDLSHDGVSEVAVGPARDPASPASVRAVLLYAHESDCDGDGVSPFQGDCDDTHASVHPGAPETCDGLDNDCDLLVDEDDDGDTYDACDDCDNLDPRIHPGAAEVCDGRDDDCDGAIDEGPDADGDGATEACDCDDTNPAIHPGAAETCDHVDANCDGRLDEGFPSTFSLIPGPNPSTAPGQGPRDLASLGDVNGDGVPDFAAGLPSNNPPGGNAAGEIAIFSGRDRSIICIGHDLVEAPGENFGAALAGLPDVTGDGIADLAVGVPNDNSSRGGVTILSGRDCSFVRSCSDPQLASTTANLGSDVATIGDLTGDGVPEIAASAPHAQPAWIGAVTVFDPMNCAPIRRLVDPNGTPQNEQGLTVAGAGDVNADGWPDIAVGETRDAIAGIDSGSVLIYSGATGSFIRRLRPADPVSGDMFGTGIALIGDLNGDGVGDLAVSAPADTEPGQPDQSGSISLFSGRDGILLRRCEAPHTLGLGVLAATGDLTGDGVPDFAAGAPADAYAAYPVFRSALGAVLFFSGSDCSLIASVRDPAARAGESLGQGLLVAGNLGGDSAPETIASSNAGIFVISHEADCDGDGVTPFLGDCDDADAARAAGRAEVCDGKDNDCDLAVDEDGDGDGYAVCADCDDGHAAVHPGAAEICDFLDNDCDGATDEGFDPDGDGLPACADNCPTVANPGQADAEGDGIGDACDVETCDGFDNDGDGSVDEGFAGLPDTCNHLDDNCDGVVDPGAPAAWNVQRVLPGGTAIAGFARSIAPVGDTDGDRVPDFLSGAALVSGATRAVRCTLVDPENQQSFGLGATGLGDVSGDGIPDVAVAAPLSFNGSGFPRGSVSIFSGADCSWLRKCADPAGTLGTAAQSLSLAGVGDVNGDGVPDLAVGDQQDSPAAGKVVVFSGADCAVVRRVTDPLAAAGAKFGIAVAGAGDLSGDGVPDLLVGASDGNGSAELVSLADGSVLRRMTDAGAPPGGGLGVSVAVLPDLTGDGVPELAAGAMLDDTPVQDTGSVLIFSGADGSRLRKCTDPAGSVRARLGAGVASYADLDGDGTTDFVAVAPGQHTSVGVRNGTALVLSGATCAVLARLDLNTGSSASVIPGAVPVAVPGDLDGDHLPEVVVGAPWANGSPVPLGFLAVFGRSSDCDGDGVTPFGGDCDDASATRAPGRIETCDAVDNDCDGQVDEDSDGDGYGACADCDNGRAAAHPGAIETCNGLDDDCDLLVDDGPDADGDGVSAVCDCQDRNAAMHPGAAEVCNRLDDDCNGRVDDASPQARVATLVTDPAGPTNAMLGYGVAGLGDVDADGVPDYAASNAQGQIVVFSGRTGSVRCRAAGKFPFAAMGDLDGDGAQDIVAGSTDGGIHYVTVFSGATCAVLTLCSITPGVSNLGTVAGVGDLDGDGVPDWAAGAPGSTASAPAGQVVVFSGVPCRIKGVMTDPTLSSGARFGSTIAVAGDLTGDGWPDLVVGAPSDSSLGVAQAGRLVVVSGPDLAPVRRLHDPAAAANDHLGLSLAAAGDVNGDGIQDVLAASTDSLGTGSVLLFSGVGDTVIRRCVDPVSIVSLNFGQSLAAAGDMTGDGIPDFVAGERADLPGAASAGEVVLVSSADCSIAERLTDPSPITNGSLARGSVAVPGDLTGDGRPDILAGSDAPAQSSTGPRGHLVVFSETSSCESPDNCPAVSNPVQANSDGDPAGNVCDVCPLITDPDQEDIDGDGVGNACDCSASDPASRLPGDQVRVDVDASGQIVWTAAASAESYLVRRGDLASRAYGNYGVCWQHVFAGARAGDTGVPDPTVPALGSGFFYLVQGEDTFCGPGSLGFDSLERPRIVSGPICP